jgi:hypothetical protein
MCLLELKDEPLSSLREAIRNEKLEIRDERLFLVFWKLAIDVYHNYK